MSSVSNENKGRFLGTTGHPCPFGCRYCFAAHPTYRPPIALNNDTVFESLGTTLDGYEIVQPAGDTELFLSPMQAFRILDELAILGKDVSFATKMVFSPRTLHRLAAYVRRLEEQGNFLCITVSLTTLDQATTLEPYAPTPQRRIANLQRMTDAGISCVVGIRPLLPVVSDAELYQLVDVTAAHCAGYLSGPYYFKDDPDMLAVEQNVEQVVVPWMNDESLWYKLSSPERESKLAAYTASVSKPFFTGSVEALKALKPVR